MQASKAARASVSRCRGLVGSRGTVVKATQRVGVFRSGRGSGYVLPWHERYSKLRPLVRWVHLPGNAAWRREKPSTNTTRWYDWPVDAGIPVDAWRAVFPEKRASSGDPSARSYTCDRSPDNSVATCDSADAARPSSSVVLTALRSGGSVRRERQACCDFQGCKACDECYAAEKS